MSTLTLSLIHIYIEPHLHNALEIVCVTSGALEFGVGQELYHMEKGDIGFVFPDVIPVSYTHLNASQSLFYSGIQKNG